MQNYEEFEDTKGVIRIRISKKNRQRNDQKKKDKRTKGQKDKQRSTKHTHKTKDRVTHLLSDIYLSNSIIFIIFCFIHYTVITTRGWFKPLNLVQNRHFL